MCPLQIVFRWLCEVNAREYRRKQLEHTECDSLARFSHRFDQTQPAVTWLNSRLVTFNKVKMKVPHLRLMIAKLVIHELFMNADELCLQLERGEEVNGERLVLKTPLQPNKALNELFRMVDHLK